VGDVEPYYDELQFISGVTIWQRVLKDMMNTLNFRSNNVYRWCA